ncbi:hypothetical protein OAF98_05735, partial [Planctomicrobium sp.]
MVGHYWQRYSGWAAGCSIYVLREVFEEVGGFDTTQFAAEERYLSEAIRKQGKFVIVKEPVLTSARKLRNSQCCDGGNGVRGIKQLLQPPH